MSNFVLKAQSPSSLAEEYLVKSIWSNTFPAGFRLPSEKELAETIGVTRTALREALQRLARDGWLTIKQGKPTKVNNIWETAGPNIIETLIDLDPSILPKVVSNVLSLRDKVAEFYIPQAIKLDNQKAFALFKGLSEIKDDAENFAQFDFNLFQKFTFIANQPVFGLIFNSFKPLYLKIAHIFFENPKMRAVTMNFYQQLKTASFNKDIKSAKTVMKKGRITTSRIWKQILKSKQFS